MYTLWTFALLFILYLCPMSQGPFSKIASGSGTHDTKMGSVAIQVVTGDITKETTDVIVNSSNDSFSLKSGKLWPKLECYNNTKTFFWI